jgi:hypothetical protein
MRWSTWCASPPRGCALPETALPADRVLTVRLDRPEEVALLSAEDGDERVVVAMVQGSCDAAGLAALQACDIVFAADDCRFVPAGEEPFDGREAERRGLITLCFPAADLERETEALASELAAKDPLALRFTKQTLRTVGVLDWDAVLAFNAAKVAELQALRAGKPSPQDLAVQSFLAGKSKPGLGT